MNAYVKVRFWNYCDQSNALYQLGWKQHLFFPAALTRPVYETLTEFSENGERWLFKRIDKRMQLVTGFIPEHIADVITHWPALSTVQVFDIDGRMYDAKDIQVEVEWINECYANCTVSFIADTWLNDKCCHNKDYTRVWPGLCNPSFEKFNTADPDNVDFLCWENTITGTAVIRAYATGVTPVSGVGFLAIVQLAGGTVTSVHQDVALYGAQAYQFTFSWARSGLAGSTTRKWKFYEVGGSNWLKDDGTWAAVDTANTLTSATPAAWNLEDASFTCPTDGVYRLVFYIEGPAIGTFLLIDDIKLQEA